MKTIASISTLCAVMAFTGIAAANVSVDDTEVNSAKHHHHHQNKSGHSEKKMMKRMIKTLSLSEQQQVEIKAIKAQAKEQREIQRDSMKKFKGEERALFQAEAFDDHAYIALHAAYQPTFAQMALTRAKTKHAVFNVLTTEQQEKWLKVMENRKEKLNRKRG